MSNATLGNLQRSRRAPDARWVRFLLIGCAAAVIGVLIIIPVIHVFYQAFSGGLTTYFAALTTDFDTRHAIFLTLIVAPTATLLNIAFGLAAAWVITRFRFPGRTTLLSLIDLPFAVSPVVAGLLLVLLFGAQGVLGPTLDSFGIKILYALPSLIIATTFVTLPFVAREVIPLMETLGSDDELAAVSLGANGWQVFLRITLPNIKWALLYGIILCNARAIGEFGAVYVVSGHISGLTDTMPLRVEKLFQEYNSTASFAVASVLTLFALFTLVLKMWLERRSAQAILEAGQVRALEEL